jgi:hypothetical protein
VLVLADQGSHDDLFTGRALCGESGQHIQAYLETIGLKEKYAILRSLPVDTLGLSTGTINNMLNHPGTVALYQAIVDEIRATSPNIGLVITFGPHAQTLSQNLNLGNLPLVSLKAWKQANALQDWQNKLAVLQGVNYPRESSNPSFTYDGKRTQIPRIDLPYGTLRWIGSSGDRARQAIVQPTNEPSPDYFKLFLPDWVYDLDPEPLSPSEQDAVDNGNI